MHKVSPLSAVTCWNFSQLLMTGLAEQLCGHKATGMEDSKALSNLAHFLWLL